MTNGQNTPGKAVRSNDEENDKQSDDKMEELAQALTQRFEMMAVSPKLPELWIRSPEAWFTLAESQFKLAGTTVEETKYHNVMSKLPHELHEEILDLTLSGFKPGHYEKLKARVIARYTESESKQLEQLLDTAEMGERKPSDFLRYMLNQAARIKVPEKIAIDRWKRKLPPAVRAQMALLKSDIDNEELGQLADQVFEAVSDTVTVAKVDREHARRTHSPRSNSPWRNRSRSPRRTNYRENGSLCWFHYHFGDEARKCRDPCKYKPKNATRDQ